MKKLLLLLAVCCVLSVSVLADNEVYFADSLSIDYGANNHVDLSYSSGSGYFYIWTASADNPKALAIAAISDVADSVVSIVGVENGNSINDTRSLNYNLGDYFVTRPQAYFINSSTEIINPDIDHFPFNATDNDIIVSFTDFLKNLPFPSPSGLPVTVHVPYGNVLYVKVDQRQEDIQLVAHMPKLSFLIPDRNFGYWGETGICWGDYNTLPYSGLTFPLQGMSGVDWQRDSSRNILGQTKTGVATKIMNTGVWYALFCPSLFGHFDLDSSSALPGASVDVTGVFSDIRLYPLSDSYSFVDNEVINGSDSEFQDYLDGEPTESGTVTWTDQDGNVSAPRSGGSSYVPEAETAESLVSQIKNILGNIVKELQTLFTFGYDAIQTLVNLMSDFVSGFSQLYTWLPAPVYSALIAAITVVIVIGVFKVFL